MELSKNRIEEEVFSNLKIVRPKMAIGESFVKLFNPIVNSGIPIEGYFSQVTKSAKGLALEILILDNALLWDIVVTRDNLVYSSFFIKDIIFCHLNITSIDVKENEEIDDRINFRMYYAEKGHVTYNSSIAHLDVFSEIKDKINKIVRG